jgi:hypothetical protein
MNKEQTISKAANLIGFNVLREVNSFFARVEQEISGQVHKHGPRLLVIGVLSHGVQ